MLKIKAFFSGLLMCQLFFSFFGQQKKRIMSRKVIIRAELSGFKGRKKAAHKSTKPQRKRPVQQQKIKRSMFLSKGERLMAEFNRAPVKKLMLSMNMTEIPIKIMVLFPRRPEKTAGFRV
jgi:hypothetical protein